MILRSRALGWALDSFDVMLYSLVLASMIQDPKLALTQAVGGQLASITLVAAAVGGIAFGVIADRIGRKRALMVSVLVYSIFTAACGFAQTVTQLAIFRICLGFGFGGEWATGVALVSETFPARHRGKALFQLCDTLRRQSRCGGHFGAQDPAVLHQPLAVRRSQLPEDCQPIPFSKQHQQPGCGTRALQMLDKLFDDAALGSHRNSGIRECLL